MAQVLLALDLAAMAGPQEFLNGKFRLSFNPSARASLLMLRLNDAALRALQECQRQQVRRARAPSSLPPTPQDLGPQPETPAKGPGDGERHSQAPDSPLLQVNPVRKTPLGTPRQILGTPLHLRLARICALPAGSASDLFPRQPRGKWWPGLCEEGAVRGEQTLREGTVRVGS